jgi:hypothetical protein
MAIENTAFLIGMGLLFNYFIVYKKNKFFGNVLYLLLGIVTFYYGSSLTAIDKNITIMIGVFIFVGSMINFIYDLLINKSTKARKRKF